MGSTGSGKSFTVASVLEQSAQLPHANIVVLDLHGEYSSMKLASHYRIAGIGDIKAKKDGAIFLQIGRASCRERVCQYVSISVVAVSLKQYESTPPMSQV